MRTSSPRAPDGGPEHVSLDRVAAMCSLTPAILRLWESRHGWPRPLRVAGGGRWFTAHQVIQVRQVAALVGDGIPIEGLARTLGA